MLSLPLLQVLPADSAATAEVSSLVENMTAPITRSGIDLEATLLSLADGALNFGVRMLVALVLLFAGRYAIRLLNRIIHRILERRGIEGVAISLLDSIIKALLYVLLGIGMATVLGVKSVSFAAVLASMGLAIGMALSGQLQNLAGGVILLISKPFKIGDAVEAQGQTGIIRAVSLFHTRLNTPDNRTIYIPNGILSSGVIMNMTEANTRRVEWIIGIDYDSDYIKAKAVLTRLLRTEDRVLTTPEPVVSLHNLGASSVDIIVRAWVPKEEYWSVYWDMNERIFSTFGVEGISFPFPQVTISQRTPASMTKA